MCTVILEPLKSEVLCSIKAKLTPCCRNEVILYLPLLKSIFSRWLLVRGEFSREERAKFVDENSNFLRSAISSMLLSSAMEGKFQIFLVDASCIMSLKDCNLNKSTSESNNKQRTLVFRTSLMIGMMNLEYPKLELLLSIMCKVTPCCRSEGIFALIFFSKQFY